MPESDVSVVPANEASWDDLQTVSPDVWAIVCFAIRPGYRGLGLTRPLTKAAVEYARARGAKVVEGYPMVPRPGQIVSWGEMHVGSRGTFIAAGFREVSHPTTRRVVMRLALVG